LKRSHIVQHRIDSGMEKIHDFVGLKRAVASHRGRPGGFAKYYAMLCHFWQSKI
jgi:hypothetical protein